MTNLLNTLKTMESETTGVKNDVIIWLLEDIENYSPQAKLQDLLQYGCESGQVSHLIYYTDTVAYYEEHKSEIMEMLEQLGIEDVESWDGLQSLSDIFPQLDDTDDRHNEAEEKIREHAEEEVSEYYGDDWGEMDDNEKETAIQGYADNVATYEVEPLKLTDHDKNYLAWAIFEYNASVLLDELDEMELID